LQWKKALDDDDDDALLAVMEDIVSRRESSSAGPDGSEQTADAVAVAADNVAAAKAEAR